MESSNEIYEDLRHSKISRSMVFSCQG